MILQFQLTEIDSNYIRSPKMSKQLEALVCQLSETVEFVPTVKHYFFTASYFHDFLIYTVSRKMITFLFYF